MRLSTGEMHFQSPAKFYEVFFVLLWPKLFQLIFRDVKVDWIVRVNACKLHAESNDKRRIFLQYSKNT